MLRYTSKNAWLLNCYSNVPYPFAISMFKYLEPLFEIYGHQRAFDIIEKEATIPGMELALVENGILYQTKLDEFAEVYNGTFQILGDNLLPLITSILKSEAFQNPKVCTTL